jgi:hypothetical protein
MSQIMPNIKSALLPLCLCIHFSFQIYDAAKCFVNSALSPTLDTVSAMKNYGAEKAQSIKELSLNKANEMLATRYGNMALSGFETTAALAEKYLDYYFPATKQELEQEKGNYMYEVQWAVAVNLNWEYHK